MARRPMPRLLESSGRETFDRCAVRYVAAMRFAPGTDARAQPLNVWMNVQVTTVSAAEAGGSATGRPTYWRP